MQNTDVEQAKAWNAMTKASTLFSLAGVLISVMAAVITSTIYVKDLLTKIDRLERQVSAINNALSFGDKVERKNGVVFNGLDDVPRCPSGYVMRGVRHSGYNYENGEIECVNLKPVLIP